MSQSRRMLPNPAYYALTQHPSLPFQLISKKTMEGYPYCMVPLPLEEKDSPALISKNTILNLREHHLSIYHHFDSQHKHGLSAFHHTASFIGPEGSIIVAHAYFNDLGEYLYCQFKDKKNANKDLYNEFYDDLKTLSCFHTQNFFNFIFILLKEEKSTYQSKVVDLLKKLDEHSKQGLTSNYLKSLKETIAAIDTLNTKVFYPDTDIRNLLISQQTFVENQQKASSSSKSMRKEKKTETETATTSSVDHIQAKASSQTLLFLTKNELLNQLAQTENIESLADKMKAQQKILTEGLDHCDPQDVDLMHEIASKQQEVDRKIEEIIIEASVKNDREQVKKLLNLEKHLFLLPTIIAASALMGHNELFLMIYREKRYQKLILSFLQKNYIFYPKKISTHDAFFSSYLHVAYLANNLELFNILLVEFKENPNAVDMTIGYSMLFSVTKSNEFYFAKSLLKAGADPNLKSV